MDVLSANDARRLAVWAQGLSVPAPPSFARSAGVPGVLRGLGAVQLDTISVLARSHELVPYARLGAVGRPAVEAAYWAPTGAAAVAFEYWSHAACLLPIESWPLYAAVRRQLAARQHPRRRMGAASRAAVLAALRDRGPLTATELGGAKRGGVWWDWSDVKIAAEDLFRWGDVVVTRRVGWRRVYDLPSRAIPSSLLEVSLSDAECLRLLIEAAGAALGVATAADLARYFSTPFSLATARAVALESALVPVTVEGWGPAFASPAALAALSAGSVPSRSRTTMLSPFDSLVWHRERMERIFGMRHRLEAYTPKERREYGYFAMPVLAGGRLVARVDPAREGRTFVARQVTFEPPSLTGRAGAASRVVASVAAALREAASWVSSDAVVVERITPPELAAPLREAVA
jgi:uncharacterized protein YcaQ